MLSRFLTLLVISASARAKLGFLPERPTWLNLCKRSDPDLNECMKHSLQSMLRAFAKGIPEVEVETFEPLFIKKISVAKGQGAVSLIGAMEDLLVHGTTNATITNVLMDLKKSRWEFGFSAPYLKLESRYNIKGNILLLPVVGAGDSTVHLWDCKCYASTSINMKKVDGREIIEIPQMEIDFKVGGMRLHLNNLFNGNKVLGQTVNSFLNKNALQVIEELKEDIGKALSEEFIVILNTAFKHIPTDLWLPDE